MASSSDPAPLVQQVSYHAWNKDLSQIAVSPNTNEVWIYVTNKSQDSSKWERKYVLDEHSGAVSGIDWCPETNLIVTCAHDRNAYVWKFDGEAWKPTLVILRINRAATCVKWSPAGNKFAVGSGAKCVPVCHYEKENDWWISKMIKKHKSTILSIAWCVNNKFIITGSSDMKARVFSAYIEGIDPAEDDGFGEVFPAQHEFGEALAEFDAGAWVHAVAWAPGGFRLAFAAHSSAIHFVQLLAGSSPIVTTVKNPHLPYLDVQFLTDNAVVGAGFDFNVDVFEVNGGSETEPQWSLKERLDKAGKDKKASTPSSASAGGFQQARGLFSDASKKGVDFGQRAEENTILTKHKNVIVNVQLVPDASGHPTKVTTAGLDGRVIFWDLPKLQ